MATDSIAARVVHRPANRKHERPFFAGMALLILAETVIGFWPSFAGPGMVEPPFRSLLVRVHGAVFSLWVLLFVVQVGLVSARRVKLHRTLGFVAMGMVPTMVVLGAIVSFAFLCRTQNYAGYVLVLTELLSFAGLMFFAFLLRLAAASSSIDLVGTGVDNSHLWCTGASGAQCLIASTYQFLDFPA